MENDELHRVVLIFENVHDREAINYPVLFIKGIIKCSSCDSIVNGNLQVTNGDQVAQFVIMEGQFKCIVHLRLGINTLTFLYESEGHVADASLHIERRFNASSRVLKLVYIIPKDDSGNFQSSPFEDCSVESACRRIIVGGMLMQTLTAEVLCNEGFGRMTFNLFCGKDKEPTCLVHNSNLTRQEFHTMSGEEIWNATARELLAANTITHSVKVLAFLSCTECKAQIDISSAAEYMYALSNTNSYVACGKGNLAMVGTNGLYSWAECINQVYDRLASQAPIDPNLLDDSGFRKTLGGCYATTLGSALHEVGHIFDLVHADQGIMARGFEDIDLFFTVTKRQISKQTSLNKGYSGNIDVTIQPRETSASNFFQSSHSSLRLKDKGSITNCRAFFHRSAAVLLSGHRWFVEHCSETVCNSISISGFEIKSKRGLRLIELHSQDCNVIKYWDFSKLPIHRFCLNACDISKKNLNILVQDIDGYLVSQKLINPLNFL